MVELLLARNKCSQCLCTRNRIVSGQRAAEIIRECRATRTHFFCHKDTDQRVHCAGVHALVQSRAHSFAVAMGIPVRLVDTDAEES